MTATELQPASVAAPRPELDWERDGNGRPRILPDPAWGEEQRQQWQAGRAWEDGTVGYTRVTTFAEALQDSSALTRWKMRRVALGMGRRPDYVTAAAALTTRDEDKDALDDVAEKALEASGPNAADVGTALHSFTERLDRGEPVGVVPQQYVGSLEAYARAVRHLRFVEFECRTVCDELGVAGTPDRVGFCDIPDPDGVVDELRIIDTKTGRVDYSAGKFSTQLAIYRRSRKYHPGTGARTTWEEAHGASVSRWGIVVHVPAGASTAELLWIGLDHGWAGAELAGQVRQWRAGADAGALLVPVFARPPRPATADGTCRGRKADGKACGYRRKTRAEGTAAQFCGRHGEQARDLERWWAENPDVDREEGVEEPAAREPVQAEQPATAADAMREMGLHRTDPATGAPLQPETAAEAALAADVFSRAEAFGDTPQEASAAADEAVTQRRQEEAAARSVAAALERRQELTGEERCDTTGLLVSACACDAHRGGMTPEEEAAQACPWCADTGCSVCQPEDYAAALTMSGTDVAAAAFEHARAAVAEQQPAPARELDQQPDVDPMHGDARLCEATTGRRCTHLNHGWQTQPQGPVGTYALDPAAEQNGNRRPQSGLGTPEAARQAAQAAVESIWQQIMHAQTEGELQNLYRQHAAVWTPDLTEWAGRRSRGIAEQRARAKPEAALLAALETAPDTGTLHRLFLQYGSGALWTVEATAAAQARWEHLAGR